MRQSNWKLSVDRRMENFTVESEKSRDILVIDFKPFNKHLSKVQCIVRRKERMS